jgi:hypothetical protein
MTEQQLDYLSYLLRLRRAGGGEATWRASLEDPHTGDLRHFASLEEAVDFVRAHMAAAQPRDDQPGKKA